MAYLGLLVVNLATQPLGCLLVLDERPYRFEGGGVREGDGDHNSYRCRFLNTVSTVSFLRPLTYVV